MTFSRRAASEMSKRVERIARKVLGERAGIMNESLNWAGTFHGIGARLIREYADQIGLNPAFTIHDREYSADLMNLVRHECGLSKTESRFPAKRTWKKCSERFTRGAPAGPPSSRSFLRHTSRPSRNRMSSITTIFSSTGRR